ncbi:uncharacterized protein ARMOST_18278 [Armillaria ostoyae]|uniref:Uncharacterized protein n=1 Tax=Armillaria ostoyae TaxID=47428 RepID=A0A284S1F1_ARMOS|nr:uncharacterized protein ARMOST_18278 [Armillaria ostoyae]
MARRNVARRCWLGVRGWRAPLFFGWWPIFCNPALRESLLRQWAVTHPRSESIYPPRVEPNTFFSMTFAPKSTLFTEDSFSGIATYSHRCH